MNSLWLNLFENVFVFKVDFCFDNFLYFLIVLLYDPAVLTCNKEKNWSDHKLGRVDQIRALLFYLVLG